MRSRLICLFTFALVCAIQTCGAAGPEDNLVLHLPFDEGTGDVAADASATGLQATLSGSYQWTMGQLGQAVAFSGGEATLVNSDPLNLPLITVMAWVNPTGIVAAVAPNHYTDIDPIYEKRGSDDDSVVLGLTGGDGVHFYIDNGGNQNLSVPDAGVRLGEWQHVAGTFDGTTSRTFLNGEQIGEMAASGTIITNTNLATVGGGTFQGAIDEVKVFDRALTVDEIVEVMYGVANPLAVSPDPADGSFSQQTWVNLSWSPGEFAVSHDVYLGDSFNDVNNGAGDTFIGNQAQTVLIVGFAGFAYPDGLVPGTTYYWRIDEVNDANAASPWKGDIWSFSIPPKTAYAPVPADGARFIEPEPTLSWTAGFGAILHTVYFGDSFDDVNAAAGGLMLEDTTLTPAGPLEAGKVYYWRVDEFTPPVTHKGEIWSFEIAGEGGGVKGQYFTGMNFENLVLTRTDSQIGFDWGNPGGPDPAVGDDQFSVRWTGQVEAAFTETYTFYTNSDDGVRLWIGGQQLVNNWTNHAATENKGSVDLVAGNTYSLQMEYYEDGSGAVAELRWSSPRTPKQIIPQAALSLPIKAGTPNPGNDATGVSLTPILTWNPGDFAASHEVYFGIDPEAVANATKASPEFKATKNVGAESYDPGKLAWHTTYYWRVDEVDNTNPNSPWVGNTWSFTTADFLVVDDFESYNNIDPPDSASSRIFDKWIDGFGTIANGALVGNDLPPYAEQTVVHGGNQSMIYRYDNAGKTSEATLTLVYPRDWTEESVTRLILWFRGASTNAADRMFVALNGTSVVYHDDASATQITGWNRWIIDLQSFAGVNLANVNTLTIGIGTKGGPAGGGAGTMYFDDIRLVR